MQLQSDPIISKIKNWILSVVMAGFLGCDLWMALVIGGHIVLDL